jgi:hypothetical protein
MAAAARPHKKLKQYKLTKNEPILHPESVMDMDTMKIHPELKSESKSDIVVCLDGILNGFIPRITKIDEKFNFETIEEMDKYLRAKYPKEPLPLLEGIEESGNYISILVGRYSTSGRFEKYILPILAEIRNIIRSNLVGMDIKMMASQKRIPKVFGLIDDKITYMDIEWFLYDLLVGTIAFIEKFKRDAKKAEIVGKVMPIRDAMIGQLSLLEKLSPDVETAQLMAAINDKVSNREHSSKGKERGDNTEKNATVMMIKITQCINHLISQLESKNGKNKGDYPRLGYITSVDRFMRFQSGRFMKTIRNDPEKKNIVNLIDYRLNHRKKTYKQEIDGMVVLITPDKTYMDVIKILEIKANSKLIVDDHMGFYLMLLGLQTLKSDIGEISFGNINIHGKEVECVINKESFKILDVHMGMYYPAACYVVLHEGDKEMGIAYYFITRLMSTHKEVIDLYSGRTTIGTLFGQSIGTRNAKRKEFVIFKEFLDFDDAMTKSNILEVTPVVTGQLFK